MKLLRILTLLLWGPLLYSEPVQKPISADEEVEVIKTFGATTHAPLSATLRLLLKGVSDATFDEAFLKKIEAAEKKRFTGEYTDAWANGQLKIKAFFKNGKVDGHVHGWYENGNEAFKAFFYENKKVGIHLAFDHSGRTSPVRRIRYNLDGQLDGHQETTHQIGALKVLMEYKKGVLDGRFVLVPEMDKCTMRADYKNGKLIRLLDTEPEPNPLMQ